MKCSGLEKSRFLLWIPRRALVTVMCGGKALTVKEGLMEMGGILLRLCFI